MLVHPLDTQSGLDKGDANVLVEFTYKDLTAASASQTLTPFTLPANWGAVLTHYELPETFVSSDGTLVSTTITAGDGGSATRQLSSTEMNAAGTVIRAKAGALGMSYYVPTSDTAQTISVACTSAKLLSSHTAGRCRLYYKLISPYTSTGQPLPFDITTKAAQ